MDSKTNGHGIKQEDNESDSTSLNPAESKYRDDASEKRSRIITSALMATIIMTLIAVAVAGVFQLTATFTKVCPAELPINDPSPVLWNDTTSDKPVTAALGVPDKLKQETALKASTNVSN
jgi:nitrate reductase NapE component